MSNLQVAAVIGSNVVLYNENQTISLTPNKARQLASLMQHAADKADSLVFNVELNLPFSPQEITYLKQQQARYELLHQVTFIDLGDFVSHVVAEQLRQVSNKSSTALLEKLEVSHGEG